MAETNNATENQEQQQPSRGFDALKEHVLAHMLDVGLWATRGAALLFTIAYHIPIIGNPTSAYYRVLLANAAISAIRLHQRLPNPTFNREFLMQLLMEDSCHYLFYSLIFLYVSPVSLVLLPVFLFCLIHFASYSLTLLDIIGQNAWWGARLMISLVEFQTRNILRCIAFTEIFMMPLVIILLLMGRAGLLTPLVYYHFLTLRYSSRRNPHTRNMFHDLRVDIESFANRPSFPVALRNALVSGMDFVGRFAPNLPQAQ